MEQAPGRITINKSTKEIGSVEKRCFGPRQAKLQRGMQAGLGKRETGIGIVIEKERRAVLRLGLRYRSGS